MPFGWLIQIPFYLLELLVGLTRDLGLSLILVRSATAFEVVKLIGAGYLVWLGIHAVRQALRSAPGRADGDDAIEPGASERRSFLEG